MRYYKHLGTGQVYAYESEQDRQKYGEPELVEMTPAEVEQHLNPPPVPPTAEEVRAQRDSLLLKTDWIVVRAQEVGDEIPEGWSQYRQALRDIPEQIGFPADVQWPDPPAD